MDTSRGPSLPFPRPFEENSSTPVDTGTGITGLPSQYQDLINANPYRNLDYNQSGWQKFVSGLGFRTKYDDFREQAQINAREYDAGILSMMQQNAYNSPSAEASRMRAAGLNPDLQGIGDVAESAQPTEDPNGMPAQDSAPEGIGVISAFAKGIYSCFMGGLSLASNLSSIKQMRTAVEGMNIDNAKKMLSTIDDMIFGSIPAEDVDSNDAQRFANSINDLAGNVPDFSNMGFTARQIKDAEEQWRTRVYSLANDERLRTSAYERYKAISESNKVRSEGMISESEQDEEVLGILISGLASTARDFYSKDVSNKLTEANVTESELLNRGDVANIESQRLEVLNDADYGAQEANADIAEVQNKRALNAVQEVINSNKEQIYKALDMAAQSGNSKAQAVLYMMVIQDFVNFEASGSVDFNILKGVSSLAKSVLKSGKSVTTGTENADSILKNLGFGADLRLKLNTK